jgi:hypothetical protein
MRKPRISDEEYEKQYEKKRIEKSIYVKLPLLLSARGITWLTLSGYFELISDASLLICAIFAVIQPFSPFILYNWEVALFATFVTFGISHMLANSFDYQEKSGIIKEKRRMKGSSMDTCDNEYD